MVPPNTFSTIPSISSSFKTTDKIKSKKKTWKEIMEELFTNMKERVLFEKEKVWSLLAKSANVERIVRHQEIGAAGIMRESRSELVYDSLEGVRQSVSKGDDKGFSKGDNKGVDKGVGEEKKRTWIDVKENGVLYGFDCEEVMYCTSNGTEKKRVGTLTNENEVVVDLYSGIGYFTLPYLVLGRCKHVHACEINPNSVRALKRNLISNNVKDKCTVYLNDNQITVPKYLNGIGDRINMGLIPSCENAFSIGIDCLKVDQGGWLHVHGNAPRKEMKKWALSVVEKCQQLILEKSQEKNCKSNRKHWIDYHCWCNHVERIKSYAPRIDHMVADIYVGPNPQIKEMTFSNVINANKLSKTAPSAPAVVQASKTEPPPMSTVNISKCQFFGEELVKIRQLFQKCVQVDHPSVIKYINKTIATEFSSNQSARDMYGNSFWVAETNGDIVGCVGVRYNTKIQLEIKHLCVNELYRGRGIGTKLINATIQHLNEVSATMQNVKEENIKEENIKEENAKEENAKEETVKEEKVKEVLTLMAETIGEKEMDAARRLYVRLNFLESKTAVVGKGVKQFQLIQYVYNPQEKPNQTKTFKPSIQIINKEDQANSNRSGNGSSSSGSTGETKSNKTKTSSGKSNLNQSGTTGMKSVSATIPSFETGSEVILTHVSSGLSMRVLIERLKRGNESTTSCHLIKMAPWKTPYERITVTQTSTVKLSSKSGRASVFAVRMVTNNNKSISHKSNGDNQIEEFQDGVNVRFESVPYQKKLNNQGTKTWHLGLTHPSNTLFKSITNMIPNCDQNEPSTLFNVTVAKKLKPFKNNLNSTRDTAVAKDATASMNMNAIHTDTINDVAIEQFVEQGYLCIKQGVSKDLVNEAVRKINYSLGRPGILVKGGVQKCTGKLDGMTAASTELMNLLLSTESGALKHVEALIGKGNLRKPGSCQIALRFPEEKEEHDDENNENEGDVKCSTLSGREWHVDGMRQGKRNPFTILLGVCLSSVPKKYHGNFTIFPQSHTTIHSLILDNGRLKGVDEDRLWSVATDPNNPWCASTGTAGTAGTAGTTGTTTSKNATETDNTVTKDSSVGSVVHQPALPDLGTPLQLLLEPGDIVLAHPKLAHRGAPNYSSNIRYMIYFRLKHVMHGTIDMQHNLIHNMYIDLAEVNRVSKLRDVNTMSKISMEMQQEQLNWLHIAQQKKYRYVPKNHKSFLFVSFDFVHNIFKTKPKNKCYTNYFLFRPYTTPLTYILASMYVRLHFC